MNRLKRAQSLAARVITGCTKNAPTDRVLIEADILTFSIRRNKLAALAYEKSIRLPVENPMRLTAEYKIETIEAKERALHSNEGHQPGRSQQFQP